MITSTKGREQNEMKSTTSQETIREMPDGRWLNMHTGEYHKSAMAASKAHSLDRKKITQRADVHADLIIWQPITPIGSLICRAL
jgi:hypothetical protein